MQTNDYDLIFLGGGLASGCVARYLKLRHPNLRILILEKKPDTTHSPGESTVGVAGLFLIRDLGLSTYMYLNHLPKNGLRYFFQPETGSADWDQSSEIGSNLLPVFPTFQVDRKRLDRDLWAMNDELGITTKYGVIYSDDDLHVGDSLHSLSYIHQGHSYKANARFVIQSQGRRGTAFDKYSPRIVDQEHITAAAWGRYQGIQDIDAMGSSEFKRRVGYTSRYLSTNHFMGAGYWIWIIPIARGLVSFGVVYDPKVLGRDLLHADSFHSFLMEHPLVSQILGTGSRVDFQSGDKLCQRAETFCTANRLVHIGDSLMFVDPFYSPGSDTISRQAYYLEHLITSPETEFDHRRNVLNELVITEFEGLKLLYKNQYRGFGSYRLFNIKALWDFHSYTNRILWPFYQQRHLDFSFVENEVRFQGRGLKATKAIQQAFTDLAEYLVAHGEYFQDNTGHYSCRQNRFIIEEWILAQRYSDQESLNHHLHLCRLAIEEILDIRFKLNGGFNRAFLHEGLLFHAVEKFSLTEEWLLHHLESSQKYFMRHLPEHIRSQVLIHVSDLTLDLPQFAQGLNRHDREAISLEWKRPADNLVRTYMHGSPKK